jgi:lactoylglutathione lyase
MSISPKPAQNTTLIELHVPEFRKLKEYYQKLGFAIVWEKQPENIKGYIVLKMNDNILCFWAGNDYVYRHPYFSKWPNDTKRGYGVEIVIMVNDIEKYYESVKDVAHVVEPLVLQPWGLKDFRAEDPNGYYLRFTGPNDILDDGNAVP